MKASNQLTDKGLLRHFLTIEGLNQQLLTGIMDRAEQFSSISNRQAKKIPLLRGKTIVNLFFENSTRTRTTFELAAKRLSADIINLNISTASTAKGESLLDTLRNLESMHADLFIVRHHQSGAAEFIAQHIASHISVINAGDGCHAHPTQAMLDMFTIRRHKYQFSNLCVAIVGDILHSRVARSQIQALTILNAGEIRVIGPKTILPTDCSLLGVQAHHDIESGLADADVIIILRLQHERMQGGLLPSTDEYFARYGLTDDKLKMAKPDAIVMHPGPINRGVEIASSVADGSQSVILEQVTHGIAVRMAIMSMTLALQSNSRKN